MAQNAPLYAAADIPPELYANAHAVIRSETKQLTINSPKSASLSCRRIVTILSEKSKENTLYLQYDQQSRISSINANLYDNTGTFIRKINQAEIKDGSAVSDFSIYEDDRYKYLAINHNNYPYTIEFEYQLQVHGIFLCQLPSWHFQNYHTAIQQAIYQIKLPKDLKLHYQVLNMEAQPNITTEGTTAIHQWQLKNLPAKAPEPYSPGTSTILPSLLVSLDQFEIKQYKGSLRSWKDFGLFIYQLSENRDQLSPAMRQKVLDLTANAANNREKVEILYRYLQQNTRYVSVQLGIGGWQPFDAAYVEKNKYGDCKALTNFMKAMLKAANVLAYPVLIYNSPQPNYLVTEDFATARFNHVILRVPREDIWLECTSTNYPVNYIGLGNANRKALMITRRGGQLIQTPSYTAQENVQQNKTQIYLDEQGGAQLNNHCILKGSKQEAHRYMSSNYSEERFKQWYQENSTLSSFQFEQFDFEAALDSPKCQLQSHLNITKYASKAGKRFFVPINKINPFQDIPKLDSNRQYPVVIHEGFTEEDQVVFHLPEGYELESAPKALVLENAFGRYSLQVEKTAEQVIFRRQLVLYATQQAAEQYIILRDFLKAVAKRDGSKMVLVKKY